MSEKPILFSGEMVQAIVDGRKTQTRFVVEPKFLYDPTDEGWDILWATGQLTCPYGHVGDRLQLGEQLEPVITAVRVERLQDISEEDAKAEGILEEWGIIGVDVDGGRGHREIFGNKYYLGNNDDSEGHDTAILAFVALWDSINAQLGYGWDSNPWVWVVEFEEAQP